jgi:hypothetical protein
VGYLSGFGTANGLNASPGPTDFPTLLQRQDESMAAAAYSSADYVASLSGSQQQGSPGATNSELGTGTLSTDGQGRVGDRPDVTTAAFLRDPQGTALQQLVVDSDVMAYLRGAQGYVQYPVAIDQAQSAYNSAATPVSGNVYDSVKIAEANDALNNALDINGLEVPGSVASVQDGGSSHALYVPNPNDAVLQPEVSVVAPGNSSGNYGGNAAIVDAQLIWGENADLSYLSGNFHGSVDTSGMGRDLQIPANILMPNLASRTSRQSAQSMAGLVLVAPTFNTKIAVDKFAVSPVPVTMQKSEREPIFTDLFSGADFSAALTAVYSGATDATGKALGIESASILGVKYGLPAILSDLPAGVGSTFAVLGAYQELKAEHPVAAGEKVTGAIGGLIGTEIGAGLVEAGIVSFVSAPILVPVALGVGLGIAATLAYRYATRAAGIHDNNK